VGSGSSPSPVEFSSHHHFYKLFPLLISSGAAVPPGQCVCLQLILEVNLPFSPLHSHKLSCPWLLGTPALSGQAWLVYLQLWEGFSSPPLWCSGHPTLFATCLYCSYCLLLSFSFLSLGGGRSVQGAMLFWPRVVCGSTAYRSAHLVRVFPSRLGAGVWWPVCPPGFSI
jgi:hypothetical protein